MTLYNPFEDDNIELRADLLGEPVTADTLPADMLDLALPSPAGQGFLSEALSDQLPVSLPVAGPTSAPAPQREALTDIFEAVAPMETPLADEVRALFPAIQYEDSPYVKGLKDRRRELITQATQPVKAGLGDALVQAFVAAIPMALAAAGGKRDAGFMAAALVPVMKDLEEERLRDVEIGRQRSLKEAEMLSEDIDEAQKKDLRRQVAEESVVMQAQKAKGQQALVETKEGLRYATQAKLERLKAMLKPIPFNDQPADEATVRGLTKTLREQGMLDMAESLEKRIGSSDHPILNAELAQMNVVICLSPLPLPRLSS